MKPGVRVSYNTSFFNTIDSPIKAYMLGYLLGDGGICHGLESGVSKKGQRWKRFRSYWCAPDFQSYRLKKFQEALGGGSLIKAKLRRDRTVSIWRLTLNGKEIYDSLYALGVRPGKEDTNVVALSVGLNGHFQSFFQGLFDADGHIDSNGYCRLHMVDGFLIRFCVKELNKFSFLPVYSTYQDKRPRTRLLHRLSCGKSLVSFLKDNYYLRVFK